MTTKNLRLLLLAALVTACSLTATGCATHDRRDAAWDPRGHRQLMDQIPNWDGAAMKICGGQYSPEDQRRLNLNPRC
jgi:outer membrane biogenesis lipoprotein LolB